MRQFVIVTVLAAIIAVAMAQVSKDEIMAAMKDFRDQCKKEFAIPDDEEAGLMQKKIPTSQEGKCFIGCMAEKGGIVKDGKFDPASASAKANMMFADSPDKLSKATAAITKCGSEVTTTDKCETGPRLMQCVMDAIPEFGMAPA